MRAILRIAQPV